MRRSGLDAAVYPISRKKWEAPYPVDIIAVKSGFYASSNTKKETNIKPICKTTSNVGERVYSKKNKRTAVIIDSTSEKIIIKFEDDGTIYKFKRNYWTIKTPFLPVLTSAI